MSMSVTPYSAGAHATRERMVVLNDGRIAYNKLMMEVL